MRITAGTNLGLSNIGHMVNMQTVVIKNIKNRITAF